VSHLPAGALSYETVVAEYFLGLRGAGLMLSPLDVEQVRAWERRGLPVAVVCRGLKRGLEDALRDRPPGAPAPRSLRAYRLAVEDEWRAYRSGRVGSGAEPAGGEESAVERRLAAARQLVSEAGDRAPAGLGPAYREAARALAPPRAPDLSGLDELFTGIDGRLVEAWRATLSREERAALGRRCALVAGPRRPGCTPRAHRAALRTHLADLARRAGLILLGGSV
jgi:hypothetical protein